MKTQAQQFQAQSSMLLYYAKLPFKIMQDFKVVLKVYKNLLQSRHSKLNSAYQNLIGPYIGFYLEISTLQP